ncbi:MAG: RluA family pseudouridine synthase [Rickettsiales bacterium]|jgi:23S rRNA pseudouridine1911/1915/1917 synthase|nr:RluA family pseudouridine synthase [Rickettsiales bacterium]
MTKTFEISESEIGMRLDKFLSDRLTNSSRCAIQRMEKSHENSHRIKQDDKIWVNLPDVIASADSAPPVRKKGTKLEVLYEDEDIIVVNKPRGMVMYPAVGNRAGTLIQELSAYCPLSSLGGATRPGVVHRLDKDTSGAVAMAKTDAAFRTLTKIFSEHDLVRKYIAFAWGVPTWTEADIEGNIARSSRNRQKMSMVKTGGKPAKTHAEVINAWTRADVSQIRCTLLTGRTHQIRVHLSSHGFGVLCDPTYGRGNHSSKIRPSPLLDFLHGHKGQCLHAEVLEFAHPITGKNLKFRAPLPQDLETLKAFLNNYM